jgi:hypothetical protein
MIKEPVFVAPASEPTALMLRSFTRGLRCSRHAFFASRPTGCLSEMKMRPVVKGQKGGVATHLLFNSRSCGVAIHRCSQYVENDCGRPAEEQHAIHRRHRPKQPPALHRSYVAVAKCRVVHKREIYEVSIGRCSAYNQVDHRPRNNFASMRDHQDRNCRNHNPNQERPWSGGLARVRKLIYPDYSCHDQRYKGWRPHRSEIVVTCHSLHKAEASRRRQSL